MAAFTRKRVWIDPPFQGRLLLRLTLYLFAYTLLGWHLAFIFEAMREVASGQGVKSFSTHYVEFLQRQLPMIVGLLAVTPALLYDLLKFSHRVAGPLFRCRKVMEEMAEGKAVREFTPRKGDLMRELFASFNLLIRACNARVAADKERVSGARPAAGAAAVCTAPAHDTPPVTPSVRV